MHLERIIPTADYDAAMSGAKCFQDEVLEALRQEGFSERDLFGVHLASEEAVVNAVRHGNYGWESGTDFDAKSAKVLGTHIAIRASLRKIEPGTAEQELGTTLVVDEEIFDSPTLHRDQTERIAEKQSRGDCLLQIEIQDEGAGFSLDDVPDPTQPHRLNVPNGRGILLMKSFMDDVKYERNSEGVLVTMQLIGVRSQIADSLAVS